MKNVMIGIQARSSSTRLPNKAHLQVGGKAILQRVIDACQIAARFLRTQFSDSTVSVCVLTPKSDCIAKFYQSQLPVIEGDENDVLSRYVMAAEQYQADYVVRVTADCLWIPPHHIAKHAKAALFKERDYTTNVIYRTFREGWDCEVVSRRLLEWLNKNASFPYDREHVTTLISKDPKDFPFRYADGTPSICHILNFYDESHIKTSIDTREEYEEAEKAFQRYKKARGEARRWGTYYT